MTTQRHPPRPTTPAHSHTDTPTTYRPPLIPGIFSVGEGIHPPPKKKKILKFRPKRLPNCVLEIVFRPGNELFELLFTVISGHICSLLLVFSVFTLFSCRFRAVD